MGCVASEVRSQYVIAEGKTLSMTIGAHRYASKRVHYRWERFEALRRPWKRVEARRHPWKCVEARRIHGSLTEVITPVPSFSDKLFPLFDIFILNRHPRHLAYFQSEGGGQTPNLRTLSGKLATCRPLDVPLHSRVPCQCAFSA